MYIQNESDCQVSASTSHLVLSSSYYLPHHCSHISDDLSFHCPYAYDCVRLDFHLCHDRDYLLFHRDDRLLPFVVVCVWYYCPRRLHHPRHPRHPPYGP